MDLKATWEEHKKFIVSTGAGALVFAVLASTIAGVEASADRLARSNANGQSDLLRTIDGLVKQEGAEKGKKNALEETAAPQILSAITWTVDPAYVLAENEKNPTLTYQSRLVQATDEITKIADQTGVTVPRNASTRKADLGLDDSPSFEGPGPKAAEALARVDVARRIVRAAMKKAGVRKILQVHPTEASYQPLDGGAGFLRRIPVTLTFEGGTAELAQLLKAFQRDPSLEDPEPFLEVGGVHVGRAKESRPEEGRLEIEVELAALTVEKAAPEGASASKAPADEGPKAGIRRRRDR